MIETGINIFLELPVDSLVKIAQEAEELGFSKCWVYDEGLVTRDPYVTLSAIACNTRKICLGTGITNPYTRHPGITASSIASLDELSNGRAFLGVGAGGSITLSPLSIKMHKPLTAVREFIVTTRRLFTGKKLTYEGKTVQFTSAQVEYARPSIEIWLAGRGPKMLALGGELADGVTLSFVFKEDLKYWTDLIRDGATRSGNKPRIAYSTAIVTSEETLEEVRPHMTYRLVDSPSAVKEKIGMTAKDVESVRNAMTKGLDVAGKLIKDEWIDPFVIRGTPQECSSELQELMNRYDMQEFILPILNTKEASRLMRETIEVIKST